LNKNSSFKKFVSTTAAITLVASAITPVLAAENVNGFTDLTSTNFGYKEVMSLKGASIIDGYNNGSFKPGQNVTREQAAKLLVNALDVKGDNKLPSYKDVRASSPWMGYLDAAYDANIIKGYSDEKFGYNEDLTREQMASILVRSFNLKSKTDIKVELTDLSKASKAHKADIETLYQNGITLGFQDGEFKPKDSVSRVTFSVFLHRSLELNSNSITSFTTKEVTIGNKEYIFDSSLSGLFKESNADALKGAKVEFTEKDGKLLSIKSLTVVSSGVKADKAEFDKNIVLDLTGISLESDLVIEGDYVTLKNGTVNGNLVVDSKVQNDFYSDGITVMGKTVISGGDDNTVVFKDATLKNVEVNKLDVRVELLGTTTLGDVLINNNSKIYSDTDKLLNKVILSDKVTQLDLNTRVKELEFKGTQQIKLVGLKAVEKLTIPTNSQLEDIISNYEDVKGIINPPTTDGGSTSPTPSNPSPVQSQLSLEKVSLNASLKKLVVTGLSNGSIVKVYNSASATTSNAQGLAVGPSLELDIASLIGSDEGSIWVTVQNPGEIESSKLQVNYSANQVELSAAGTYGGTPEMIKVYEGDVIVSSADVNLDNAIIKGNLVIAASVGNGDASFTNVTVEGETVVQGGGENSVYFIDSVLLTVIVNKNNGSVRVVAQGTTQVQQVLLESGAKLDEEGMTGDAVGFTNVEITEAVQNSTGMVVLEGSFETVNSRANNVQVVLTSETTLNDLVLSALTTVLGTGAIRNLTVTGTASGSTVEQSPQSVVLDIDGASITIGETVIEESYSNVEQTSIEDVEATMSYLRVDLADPKVDLTSNDFLVTATIDGQPIELNNLEYLPTRRMFTFDPISITPENSGKTVEITISPIEAEATVGENTDDRKVIGESKVATFIVSTGLSGRITDTYGRGIANLNVTFEENGLRATTDRNGYYSISIEPGVYEGVISGAGYLNTNILGTVVDDSFTTGVNETAIRAASSNEMKIMLTWNGMESDLDSHLATSNFHVFYADRIHGEDLNNDSIIDTEYVDLDWDDTDYFGPETTTIREWQDGRYVFFIHNFSGENPLSESDAKVQIFNGNSTEANHTFTIPTNTEDARYWGVFELQVSDGGETIVVNELNILADNEQWLINPKGSLEAIIQVAEELMTFENITDENKQTLSVLLESAQVVFDNEASTTVDIVSEITKINDLVKNLNPDDSDVIYYNGPLGMYPFMNENNTFGFNEYVWARGVFDASYFANSEEYDSSQIFTLNARIEKFSNEDTGSTPVANKEMYIYSDTTFIGVTNDQGVVEIASGSIAELGENLSNDFSVDSSYDIEGEYRISFELVNDEEVIEFSQFNNFTVIDNLEEIPVDLGTQTIDESSDQLNITMNFQEAQSLEFDGSVLGTYANDNIIDSSDMKVILSMTDKTTNLPVEPNMEVTNFEIVDGRIQFGGFDEYFIQDENISNEVTLIIGNGTDTWNESSLPTEETLYPLTVNYYDIYGSGPIAYSLINFKGITE